MADVRDQRTGRVFQSHSHQQEDHKANRNARRSKRQSRHVSHSIADGIHKVTSKVRQWIHSKPQHSSRAQEECSKNKPTQKNSFQKPPFIVGKVRHNDLYLIQAVPQPKSNVGCTKKPAPMKPSTSATKSVHPTLGKIRTAKQNSDIEESLASKKLQPNFSIASEFDTFTSITVRPSINVVNKNLCEACSSTPQQKATSKTKPKQSGPNNFTPQRRNSPYITRDRQFSEQKPFSSLVASHERPAPLIQAFSESEVDDTSSDDDDFPQKPTASYSKPGDGAEIEKSTERDTAESTSTSETQNKSHEGDTDSGKICSEDKGFNATQPTNDLNLKNISPQKVETAKRLRDRMSRTSFKLEELRCHWNSVLEKGQVPIDEMGEILTVVGQTQQLLTDRFLQYSNLIDQFVNNNGIKAIESTDLEGFWEMISLQVTDVEKKFTDLDILHKNGWIRMETLNDVQAKKSSVKTGKTKTFKTDAVKSKSGIRSHIESMRRQKNDLIVSPKSSDEANQSDQLNMENHQDSGCVSLLKGLNESNEEETAVTEANKHERFFDSPTVKEETDASNQQKEASRAIKKRHNSAKIFFTPVNESPRQRSHSASDTLGIKPTGSSPALSKSSFIFRHLKHLVVQTSPKVRPDSGQTPNSPNLIDSPTPKIEENNNNEEFTGTAIQITVSEVN